MTPIPNKAAAAGRRGARSARALRRPGAMLGTLPDCDAGAPSTETAPFYPRTPSYRLRDIRSHEVCVATGLPVLLR